jgi:hypothetical protein
VPNPSIVRKSKLPPRLLARPSRRCSTILIWVRSRPITRSRRAGDFFAPAAPPRQKCGMRVSRVDRALFSRNAISKPLPQTSGLGEDNGNHTHDTSRSSDNTKSFNLPDRARNVRHRWRRFYLRALWTCHVGGFRSFNNQRQSCLSVRRL